MTEDENAAKLMSRINCDSYHDENRRQMIHRMTVDIFAVEHPNRTYSYPISAWQYLKRDYAPKWFLKRWPVIEHTIRVSLSECYPDFTPSIPNDRSVVKVLVNESTGPSR